MNTIQLDQSVLVLIDYQTRLMPSMDDGELLIAHAIRLADMAIALGVPVIGTEQNPASLGLNVPSIRSRCGRIVEKTHFDACADGLLDVLASARPKRGADASLDIVIAGCEAHVCLMQTSLGLLRAGHRVWVVAEASGSRLAFNRKQALRRLRQSGAQLVGVEMVAFEWLKDCRHERFKHLLPMLKAAPVSSR
ncbi:MAG: isochorismatase family protein [Ideonella sp.]